MEIKNVRFEGEKMQKAAKPQKRKVKENVSIMVNDFSWSVRKTADSFKRNFGKAVLAVTPFVAIILGELAYMQRGKFEVGGEWLVVLLLVVTGFIAMWYSKVSGYDYSGLPVPYKRFTTVDEESGQVDVDYDRVQELILYTADLEDWLKRTGYMR